MGLFVKKGNYANTLGAHLSEMGKEEKRNSKKDEIKKRYIEKYPEK